MNNYSVKAPLSYKKSYKWGAFYLLIANFFAIQIIGGDKDLVVLL